MFRFLAGLAVVVGLAASSGGRAAEISISCSALGKEYEICKEGVEAWARSSGHTVRLVSTPNSGTERLALYQQLMAARAGDIDVLQMDVVWTGTLGEHLRDLTADQQGAVDQHLPAMVEAARVNGKLVAMPWFADAGLLYYRQDLLQAYGRPVPQTWAELEESARLIQESERKAGREAFWGYVWQGRAYEGLTTNALEWIASHGGGSIVDRTGAITIDNPNAAAALRQAAGWIGTISPEGVLNYTEEEARGVFQAGNAAFMRNWPYAWALAQGADSPVKGKIGVAPLPKGGPEGRHVGTLGGQLLAASRYSKNPEAATDLVRFLTGSQEQKRRAIEGSFNPTLPALYDDPEVVGAIPFMAELREVFANAVARPASVTGDNYNRVSTEFFNTVHRILADRAEPGPELKRLERSLARIKRGDWRR